MAERDCEHCGQTYARPPSLLGRYCSKACAYAARTLERTNVRRGVYAPAHPLAPKGGYIPNARVVLYEKIGPGPHECHWCQEPIRWTVGLSGNSRGTITADHLNSDPLDDRPENLVAACGPCNGQRARAVGNDEAFIVRADGTRLRGELRRCEACSKEFAAWPDPRPGRGRFCSRSCARKAPRRTS